MTTGLTALDITALLCIGIGAVFGLMRGFLTEVFLLVAWVAGIAAVKLFHAPVAGWLEGPIGTVGGAQVLALALLFGGTLLAVRFAGRGLGRRAKASVLGPVDRILGLGFGALKGLLAITIGFLLITLVLDTVRGGSAPRPEWMTKSRSYDLLRASSAAVSQFVDDRRKR